MYTRIASFGLILFLSMAVLSCATAPPPGYYNEGYRSGEQYAGWPDGSVNQPQIAGNTMAVLGVVSAGKKLRAFQRKNLAIDLETKLRAQDVSTPVMPFSQVQSALKSNGQHRLMLDRYKINGRLTEADWGVLGAVRLPVRYLVVARIDRDETERYDPIKTPMKNSHGDSLTDRQQVTLLHKRTVEVAARVYDLTNGNEVWSGAYVSEPANQNSYTEYTGSSFTGSMATLLTNSFTHGRTGKQHPPAPSAAEALREAFRTIAAAIVGRGSARASN